MVTRIKSIISDLLLKKLFTKSITVDIILLGTTGRGTISYTTIVE